MPAIKNFQISKNEQGFIITLYLDDINTEFASELGSNPNDSNVKKEVNSYIKNKFPNIKKATVKLMVGTMLVGSFAYTAPALAADGTGDGGTPPTEQTGDEGTIPGDETGGDEGTIPGDETGGDEGTTPEDETGGDEGTTPDEETGGEDEGATPGEIELKDLVAGAYYEEPVRELVKSGIIKGYPDGTFQPSKNITRAEFVNILANALDNLDLENAPDPDFKDVTNKNAYYYKALAALKEAGIVSGYEDETFKPNQPISRAEVAKLLVTAFEGLEEKEGTTPFTDVKEGVWYAKYVAPLIEKEITFGKTSTTFAPNSSTTRGEAATFIYRALGIDDTGEVATPAVTMNFDGFTDIVADQEKTFSITTKAENVSQDVSVRYKFELIGPDGNPVDNFTIGYEASPDNWETLTTDEEGIAYFGPATGFKTEALGLHEGDGLTTNFKATFTTPGDYTLKAYLVNVVNDEVVGDTVEKTFTVGDPIELAIPGDVTIDFDGFTDIVAGEEHTMSITAKAENVSQDINVRYKVELIGPDGNPVTHLAIDYEATPGTWETMSTDENGIGYFGPEAGFKTEDIGLQNGITTNFKTALANAGDYTLKISLVDVDSGNTVDEVIEHTFTVAEATTP